MTEETSRPWDIRDVIIYTGKVQRLSGEDFEERKKRPAVIFLKEKFDRETIVLAAPLNSTVKEVWNGPSTRYCITPTKAYTDYLKSLSENERKELFGVNDIDFTKYNNLEKVSQVAVNNTFLVEQKNFVRKIGMIDSVDYECINLMFRKYVAWLKEHSGT